MFFRKKRDFGHFFIQKFLVKFRQTFFFRFAVQELKRDFQWFCKLAVRRRSLFCFWRFSGGVGNCRFCRFLVILENRWAKGIVLLYAGLWRNTFASKLGFALVASGWPPGRALAKSLGPWARFLQSVLITGWLRVAYGLVKTVPKCKKTAVAPKKRPLSTTEYKQTLEHKATKRLFKPITRWVRVADRLVKTALHVPIKTGCLSLLFASPEHLPLNLISRCSP